MARRRGQRTGFVYRRGNSWFGQFRIDTPELDTKGKFKRKTLTKFIAPAAGPGKVLKKRAMQLFYDDHLKDLHKSGPLSMFALRDFVRERFIPDVVFACKPSGKAHYTYILQNHVIPALGDFPMRDIRPQHIQDLMHAKLAARVVECKTVKGLSVQTAVHIRNTLSAIFRHAKRVQAYSGDLPTEGVRLPSLQAAVKRALTWDQVQKLAAWIGHSDPAKPKGTRGPARDPEKIAQDNVQLGALVTVLAVTGLRIGEAMGLRWKRVNLSAEPAMVDGELLPGYTMAVRENYVRGVYGTLKTHTSRRNVPLNTDALRELGKVRAQSKFTGADHPVFSGQKSGQPLDQHNIAARFLRIAGKRKEVGCPWVSWHVLRHTAATLADQVGLSVSERQRVLGHAAGSMTLHYTHAELDRVREGMEKIGKERVQ